jgi:thiosulfate/3-mercaptopyruvate sulfurtransferase
MKSLHTRISTAAVLAAGLVSICSAASRPEMLVSTEWLSAHLNDPKIVVLHVSGNRTAYDAGHIPGARFVAQGELAVTKDGIPNELPEVGKLKALLESAGVSDDTRVILYGDTSVLPATRAYFTLDYLGHEGTALLDGGLGKWQSEGRTLTKDPPAAAVGHLTPHVKPALVVQMDEVKKMSAKAAAGTPESVLLDVRGAADFTGEKGSHIPGAVNAFWMDSQMSRENQALKSDEDMRKMFAAAGIKPDSKVVTYCNSGMQASQSYFTLKYLGYDVRMYDGSMSEWTAKGGPTQK